MKRPLIVAQHDRPGAPEDDAGAGGGQVRERELDLLAERGLVERSGIRRCSPRDHGRREAGDEAAAHAGDRVLGGERLVERDRQPLGHRNRDRAIEQRDAESAGQCVRDPAAAGAVRGRHGDQSHATRSRCQPADGAPAWASGSRPSSRRTSSASWAVSW